MSLSDLASIGSVISGLAVLASLVYLGMQVRQADRNQQASTRTARAARTIELLMGCAEPQVAEAVLAGLRGDATTDTQVFQFMNYFLARFFNAEDAFYHHREGLLDAFYVEGIASGLRTSLSYPGMRALYRKNRPMFGREFAEFVDGLLVTTPMASSASLARQFRADVAAEQATITAA